MKTIQVIYAGKPIYSAKEEWSGTTALLIAVIFQRIDQLDIEIEDAGFLHIEITGK